MGKHYIFSDTHHGAASVVKFLKSRAQKEGKVSASSTGDFFNYAANDRAPATLNHAWSEAYKAGDKAGMKKHAKSWTRKVVGPQTTNSGAQFQQLKPILKGGKINAIYGNSDFAVYGVTKPYDPRPIETLLGGQRSAVRHISDIKVRKEGKTTFVYVPHDPNVASYYKGMSYGTVKTRLEKDPGYANKMQHLKRRLTTYNGQKIVMMVHEAPAPERWYGQGTEKTKNRLPAALKAHYDSVLEQVVGTAGAKNVTIFHGHLHENSKKDYRYKGVRTRLLDIGDVVKYDTDKGTYRIQHLRQPSIDDLKVLKDQKKPLKFPGGQDYEAQQSYQKAA
jgi:hypothetical protein